jgi:hypothetical protein
MLKIAQPGVIAGMNFRGEKNKKRSNKKKRERLKQRGLNSHSSRT